MCASQQKTESMSCATSISLTRDGVVWRLLVTLWIVVVAGCGGGGEPMKLAEASLPSTRFCWDVEAVMNEYAAGRSDPAALRRLADRLDVDEDTLLEAGDAFVAGVARRVANRLRGPVEWPKVLQALGGLPADVCFPPRDYTWEQGDEMELQVPANWQGALENWNVVGRGHVGSALRAGGSSRVASLLGDAHRWYFPTAYLAVSRSLAKDLRVNEGRTALALDRVRSWMESNALPDGCRHVRVAPYAKGPIWGFMRRSEGCGGVGAVLIEIYAVALHREERASVVLLQLTGRHHGSIGIFRRALSSFHVIH